MTLLRFSLLGRFEIGLPEAAPLRFGTRKAKALLAYLALQRGARISRQALASLLWFDRPDKQAHGNLRQTLTHIRKSLAGIDPSPLIVSDGVVALEPEGIDVDAITFDDLMAEESFESLTAASELYRGDLLAGFSLGEPHFEEWLEHTRLEYKERVIRLHRALIDAAVLNGTRSAAIDHARRLLTFNPFDEEAQRHLMQLYAETGQAHRSLEAFKTFRDLLDEELSVPPEKETLELIEAIKSGRLLLGSSPAIRGAPSIAIIPFQELQTLPNQEHFADGLTEDLIAGFSRFRWFLVADRSASFAYKAKHIDVRRVAAELGVRYVVMGSVRKSVGKVRVTARLVEGETGNHLWAGHYDRDLADIFDLQDAITEEIVGVIEPAIGSAERARAARKPPASLDAWDCYHRGLWHFWKVTRRDFDLAGKLLQSACGLDPEFAPAHSARAYQLFSKVVIGWAEDREKTLERAWSTARKALALDDMDAFAHMTLGRILTLRRHYDSAIEELESALSLNPYLALAHYGLGFALYRVGQVEGALLCVERAIRQSPFDPLRWRFEELAGEICFALDRYDEAKAWLVRAERNANSDFWPSLHLSAVQVEMGHLEEAKATIQNAISLEPGLSIETLDAAIGDIHPDYKYRILGNLSDVGTLPKK